MKARSLDAARARKLKRVGLVVVAVALVWQILTLQLSDFFVDAAVNGDSSALQTALWWDAHHPLALAMLGADARGAGRPDAALSLLRQSIGADPANARPHLSVEDELRSRATNLEQTLRSSQNLANGQSRNSRALATAGWAMMMSKCRRCSRTRLQ